MRVRLIYHVVLYLVYAISAHAQTAVQVCSAGDIRLAGGTSYLVGRVEVCLNNQWGTVCDDDFDVREAEVVCRQLGYSDTGASVADSGDYETGTVDQPIFLDDLLCDGAEDHLNACPKGDNCQHSEDAGVRCQHDDVRLTFDGNLLPNNTVIRINDITDSNNNGITLLCITNKQPCCSSPPNRFGEWYYPNGTQFMNQASGYGLYRGRGDNQSVRLNRQTAALDTIPGGIYHCEVPDKNNIPQYLYVGLYSESEGNISISDLTYDRDTQFLVCTSTGGPATTVKWTKDNLTLSIDGTLYQQTQVITDMTESVYENRLRIINQASISSGLYSCTVTNDRGSATSELYISVCRTGESRVLEMTADAVQIELCFDNEWFAYNVTSDQRDTEPSAMPFFTIETNGMMSSVEVSWVPPASGSNSITNYQITCSSHDTQQKHTVSITTAPIAGNTVTFRGLMATTRYECCVTAYGMNPMVAIATTCEMITTREESVLCTTDSNVAPSAETQSNSSIATALGAVVGVLILMLVVITTALCILVIMFKTSKKNKTSSPDQSYVTRQPPRYAGSRVRDERLLTNPIYSTSRPRSNTTASVKSVNIPNPIYSSTTTLNTIAPQNSKPDSNYASIPDLDSKPDSDYAVIDVSRRTGAGTSTAHTSDISYGRTSASTINDATGNVGATYAEINELKRNGIATESQI